MTSIAANHNAIHRFMFPGLQSFVVQGHSNKANTLCQTREFHYLNKMEAISVVVHIYGQFLKYELRAGQPVRPVMRRGPYTIMLAM
jgi:hypothetical protein